MKKEVRETLCTRCGGELTWCDCYECDADGYVDHDCGDDTCCCLNPEPNVTCDICDGRRGWLQCYGCFPYEED